jgi:hypothetical protein
MHRIRLPRAVRVDIQGVAYANVQIKMNGYFCNRGSRKTTSVGAAIDTGRNSIVVLNRKGIERLAGNSYGIPEKYAVSLAKKRIRKRASFFDHLAGAQQLSGYPH